MRQTLTRLCWTISWIILMLAGVSSANASPARALPPTRSAPAILSPLVSAEPDFSKFAGAWYAHGAGLSLSQNGDATYNERVYSWCGPGVPQPCDSMEGNMIHPGHQEQIHFSRVSGSTAYGTVTASNFHPRGLAVTIQLQPNDMLIYASTSTIAVLCGPSAPAGACGA